MGIAELGQVVILWYETDVSEKAERRVGEHILMLERKCYLILFLLFEFRPPSSVRKRPRSEMSRLGGCRSAVHMHEVLRKVLKLVFISGVS